MFIETRIVRLVKKTGVKKSRWTVPLIKVAIRRDSSMILMTSVSHKSNPPGFPDSHPEWISNMASKSAKTLTLKVIPSCGQRQFELDPIQSIRFKFD
jgi:hypothetical protein